MPDRIFPASAAFMVGGSISDGWYLPGQCTITGIRQCGAAVNMAMGGDFSLSLPQMPGNHRVYLLYGGSERQPARGAPSVLAFPKDTRFDEGEPFPASLVAIPDR